MTGSNPETLRAAQEFADSVWGFVTPEHAARLGVVPELEVVVAQPDEQYAIASVDGEPVFEK